MIKEQNRNELVYPNYNEILENITINQQVTTIVTNTSDEWLNISDNMCATYDAIEMLLNAD